jgi:hypothetical protein
VPGQTIKAIGSASTKPMVTNYLPPGLRRDGAPTGTWRTAAAEELLDRVRELDVRPLPCLVPLDVIRDVFGVCRVFDAIKTGELLPNSSPVRLGIHPRKLDKPARVFRLGKRFTVR